MISDEQKNKVYFSSLLPVRCPKTYQGLIEVLDKYNVPHALLEGTNDIWCRDYMPIQAIEDRFVAFGYNPDYLQDTPEHRASITDGYEVACKNTCYHISDDRGILVDGGNIVNHGIKMVMTAKVLEENPGISLRRFVEHLEMTLGAELILLPWDTEEIYGHTDGILRFVDDDTVIMTNYRQFDPDMADRFYYMLEPHFKIHELKYKVKKPYKNNYAYINWLQTDKVLIIPKFNVEEDDQALAQITKWMPQYKGRIEQVDATDLIRYEGCLNCASWTVKE